MKYTRTAAPFLFGIPTLLLCALYVLTSGLVLADPSGITVTTVKYVDGVHADASNASGVSFPMKAIWNAANLGHGSGVSSLGPVGINNPEPYETTTGGMSAGANYTTFETFNSVVGANCFSHRPYANAGYTTSLVSLADAASKVPSPAIPNFVNLQSNAFVIVWNKNCIPHLTVTKIVINDNGGTAVADDFALFIDGVPTTSGFASTTTAGVHKVSETPDPRYFSTISGDCTQSGFITLQGGENAECIITNNDIPAALTIVKHADGADAAFEFEITDGVASATTSLATVAGWATSSPFYLDTGTYDIRENTKTGWDFNGASCIRDEQSIGTPIVPFPDFAGGASITVAVGEQILCTFDNTEQSDVTVTVVKYVDGQHADATNAEAESFPMDSVWDATSGSGSGSFSLGPIGSNNPNPYEMTTDIMSHGADYSVSEDTSGPTVGADCSAGTPFALVGYTWGNLLSGAAAQTLVASLALADITHNAFVIVWNKDCTPHLVLDKVVVNNDSGTQPESAWTLTASGPSLLEGQGAATVGDVYSDQSFLPGTYDLSETGPSGYDASAWTCVGGTQVDGDTVTIAAGETVICTIVNDDTPVPLPPANACSNLLTAPLGYTLVNGTKGSDTVTILPFTMFVGKGGNDKVTGGDGNFIVCTDKGNDTIQLGNGSITIDAGNGNNIITTGNGSGFIATGKANDKITTGTGVHTINADTGSNTIVTGDGDQTITTGNSIDQITTGAGNDVINAGQGIGIIKSGAGNDTVTTGTSIDTIDGGADFDTCNAGAGARNNVTNCEA